MIDDLTYITTVEPIPEHIDLPVFVCGKEAN